jgi:hypothetical protein
MNERQLERFLSKVAVDDETGCWVWTAAIDNTGYGRFHLEARRVPGRRPIVAHRVSYEHFVGPIPEGLTLDHLCRNRGCVNPGHLEPVTNRDNVLRGEGITAANAVKTHCDNGHEFTPENTYEWGGSRYCRQCRADRERKAYRARKAVAA